MNERVKVLLIAFVFGVIVFGSSKVIKLNTPSSEKVISSDKNGIVLEVNSSGFKEEVLDSDKKVLIDFYATWCEPCKRQSPIIEELASDIENVKFVKIDVDKARDIASQYGIRSIPTLVIIENGKEVERKVGLTGKSTLISLLK